MKLMRYKGMKSLYDRVSIDLFRGVMRQFETQGRHFGTPWTPLAESTKYKRQARYGLPGGHLALLDTFKTRNSFKFSATETHARVYSKNVLAIFHHYGIDRSWTIKPKRRGVKFLKIYNRRGIYTDDAGYHYSLRKSVRRHGLPARPILPSTQRALLLAIDSIEATVREKGII